MKSLKLSQFFRVVKPEYAFLKLTPNNAIRNQSTHKIAKSIASIYRNVARNIKAEEVKVKRILNKDFLIGTKYAFEVNPKVSYYIYMEKKKIEFYFILPKNHMSLLKEKISDSWTNITAKEVEELPAFSESATQLQLVYQKEDALSLATDRRNDDLLKSNLNVVDVMEEGDKVGIFYNFLPVTQFSWRASYENTIRKVKRNLPTDRNKMGAAYLAKGAVGIITSVLDDIFEVLSGPKKKGNDLNVFENLLEALNGGKKISPCTMRKSTATILGSQIAVLSESKEKTRQINNARALAQSFETISEDNRLIPKPLSKPLDFTAYSIGADINKIGDEEAQNFISLAGREILEKYNFVEKIDTQETEIPEDLQKGVMCIGENTFRGKKQKAYLSDFIHYRNLLTLLIGPTRAGKSNLIANLCIDAIENNECVILFDFIENCELSQDISALFPAAKVLNIDNSDPDKIQGLGYNEVGFVEDTADQYENAKRQTANLLALINAVNVDESRLSPKMERYLEAAALVVFISNGSINDVFKVLQNAKTRYDFLHQVPKEQYEYMEEYMQSLRELDELENDKPIGTKLHLIVGIIDRLNILKRNTQMERMLKTGMGGNVNLVEEMEKNQVICIRMPESKFPTQGERDIACTYWITKIWLALQIRADLIRDKEKRKKVNLVIDEIYQVDNCERFVKEKLSQIAKFVCKPIISCHYINQLKHMRSELRSANTSYMLISGCDRQNFLELKSELSPFTEEDLLSMKPYYSMNYVKCQSGSGYAKFITKLPGAVQKRIKEGKETIELEKVQ